MVAPVGPRRIPFTCWTDVSLRSHKSSNGWTAAGSKSFVYCRIPDVAVKQHLHMHEWYRRRPSSRYGCASASITDILLSCNGSGLAEALGSGDGAVLAAYRVEDEHLAQKMHGVVRRVRAERVQRRHGRRLRGPAQHVRAGALARVPHVLQRRGAQQLGDQLQLLDGALRLEEDAPAEQLAEYAAHGPDVHRRRVVARAHQDLRAAVVLGDHLLRHVLRLVGLLHAGQPEVANLQRRERTVTREPNSSVAAGTYLQHAIAVHEQIARLDVPVQYPRRVQILESSQNLVQEHFYVIGRQMLRRHDNLVQVWLK